MTLRRAVIALAAIGCCLGATGAAHARSKKREHHHHHQHKARGRHPTGVASEGKTHLNRANELAGDDDCKAAVDEYTKAFVLLDDPAVLFSRAECYRRLGEDEHALEDYHLFLDRVPKASNRAEIEAKMAALVGAEPPEKPEKPEKSGETPPPPPPKEAEARPAPPPPEPAPPPPAVLPPAAPEAKPEPVLTLRRAAVADDAGPARGTRPWVWVALAVLVAGAAVGGYFMLRPRPEAPPTSALGNYRF